MPFRVVCISHTEEAGGAGIGQAVAARLGFRYVDEEIIARAARTAQVDPALVAATEKKQPLLQRLFDAVAAATVIGSPVAVAGGFFPETPSSQMGLLPTSNEDLRLLIRAAILDVAKTGDAVIVAHAASLALVGKPGVLRVLVTAPDKVRVRRAAKSRGLPEAEAEAVVEKSDEGRRNYLRTFYEIREELPTHYDVVINTEVLTPEQASELIVEAARY